MSHSFGYGECGGCHCTRHCPECAKARQSTYAFRMQLLKNVQAQAGLFRTETKRVIVCRCPKTHRWFWFKRVRIIKMSEVETDTTGMLASWPIPYIVWNTVEVTLA